MKAEIDFLKANLVAIQVLRQCCQYVAILAEACGIISPSAH